MIVFIVGWFLLITINKYLLDIKVVSTDYIGRMSMIWFARYMRLVFRNVTEELNDILLVRYLAMLLKNLMIFYHLKALFRMPGRIA